jgi:uncharacterized protein
MRLRFLLITPLVLTGCVYVKMEPIEVHAIVDVNVKVDQALNDFFGDLDSKSKTIKPLEPLFSMNNFLVRLVLVFSFVCAGAPLLRAQDLGAIKQRMEARLSTLDALKTNGTVGENNQGFVEVKSAQDEAALVVAAENADRLAVYEVIARKTGSTVAKVGGARARQIAAGSKAGVWVQQEDGAWVKK